MSLKRKVLLTISLGILSLNAGIYLATDATVMSGFLEQELADADRRAASTREIVGMLLEERLTRMVDWANWDDMAQFLADGNQAFVDSNIEAGALAALQWDVVHVAQGNGTGKLLVGLDPARENLVEPDPRLVAHLHDPNTHLRAGEPLVGLVTVGDTIWITASRQVHRTDHSEPAIPGRLITCTRIDDGWLQRLRKFTSLDVSLRRADESPVDATEAAARRDLAAAPGLVATQPVSDAELASFCWLGDLHGKPSVLLRIDRDRPLLAQGHSILRSTMLTIGGAGGVLLLLSLFGVSGLLRRLGHLLAGVQALRTGKATVVPVARRDELGQLTTAFNDMASTIVDRERSLSSINERMRLVLDSTGDGLVTCNLDGTVEGGVSLAARSWFGEPEGQVVWDYLFAGNDAQRVQFQLGWQQLQDGLLPFELLVDQMPRRFELACAHYEIDFKPIGKDGSLTGLLLIVKDITARLDGERAERSARELQAIVANILRDTADFQRFLAEMQTLLERVVHTCEDDVQKRSLHTMKGNAAVYGFTGFAELCHRIEGELAEGQPFALHAAELQTGWLDALQRVHNFLPDTNTAQVVLSQDEYDHFVARLVRGEEPHDLLHIAESWRFQPVASVFARMARQAHRVATALGKQVRVTTQDQALRFDPEAMAGFWESLVHVIRNAIDHGIEAPERRRRGGKPAEGHLLLGAHLAGDDLVVSITDDGGGIDWAAVRDRARQQALPHATHEELVAALFTDGLSTRFEVTELSGRGVGLAAVQEACRTLGGTIDVRSEPGVGTTFAFRLPKHCDSKLLAVTCS